MIVYCCNDLIFATKIRSTAETLGIVTRPVRNSAMLDARLHRVDDGKPHAPVSAVMVDLDCGEDGIALITQTKTHDAAIPVIAFGSHVAAELLQAARRAGADKVLPRSAFTTQLPALLQQHQAAT